MRQSNIKYDNTTAKEKDITPPRKKISTKTKPLSSKIRNYNKQILIPPFKILVIISFRKRKKISNYKLMQ